MPPNDEITNTATAVDSTEVSPPAHLATLLPGSKLGRYEIGDVIGAGGMGVVYRARDPELNRDVAIKVIRAQPGRSQDRLLAEARAMAKLDHPSVMPIFDVGTFDDGVYLVMPHLTGGTLHEWIHAEPRPWRDVVQRFVKAGRGLAAAHAAGLVHRDFKPRNVLLEGDDVLVADFGLVAGGSDVPGGTATHASAIAGTPGYMAPEQTSGETIDGRADQFSFCVSLWEGLHGERPTQAETRSHAVLSVKPVHTGPAARRDTPGWLREAVARGFSEDRARRWRTMDALLDHLAAHRRRRVALAAGAGAVGVLTLCIAFLFLSKSKEKASCTDGRARVDAIWNPTVRASIEAAFGTANASYATPVLARVTTTLDQRTADWRNARLATCRAAGTTHAPAASTDIRMRCLDRWLEEASGTISLLQAVRDQGSLDAAASATRALSSATLCAESKALSTEPILPPEKREAVTSLESEIQGLTTARRADKAPVPDLILKAEDITARARATGYAPTLTRALRILAVLQLDAQDATAARITYEEMAKTAANAGDDGAAASAWTELTMVVGAVMGLPAEARQYLPAADAAVTRAGNEPAARAKLMYVEAMVIDDDGEADRALDLLQKARNILVAAGANQPDSPLLQLNLNIGGAIGAAHGAAQRFDESLAAFRENLAASEAVYGPEHPWVAVIHSNIGTTLQRAHRWEEALSAYQRSAQVQEQSGGETPKLVAALKSVGDCYAMMDRPDEALAAYERATSIAERVSPPSDKLRISIVQARAQVLRQQDKTDEAIRLFDEAIAIYEAMDPVPKDLATALHNRAGTLRDAGQLDRSIVDYRRSLELIETFPMLARTKSTSQAGLASTLILAGRPAEAIPLLEQVLADTQPGRDIRIQKIARWLIGRARVESGRDVSRGLSEVRAARQVMIDGGARPEEVEELDNWLAKHRR